MSYKVLLSAIFEKHFKVLHKKYPSLKKDLLALISVLEKNPTAGIHLGKNCFKIRLKIASKVSGKSSGARIIYYVKFIDEVVHLLDIYDKTEKDSISDKEIKALLKSNIT